MLQPVDLFRFSQSSSSSNNLMRALSIFDRRLRFVAQLTVSLCVLMHLLIFVYKKLTSLLRGCVSLEFSVSRHSASSAVLGNSADCFRASSRLALADFDACSTSPKRIFVCSKSARPLVTFASDYAEICVSCAWAVFAFASSTSRTTIR